MIWGKHCEACPFKNYKKVPPQRNPYASIAIIGEAPGYYEEREGHVFVGGSGSVLNMLLTATGIDCMGCHITNVLKCRPPGNNIDCPEAKEAINYCVNYLYEELETLSYKNVIVALGATALTALGISHKISSIRGTIIESERWGNIIATWHPAYIMRQWQEYPTAIYDWKKISRYGKGYEFLQVKENFKLFPTITEVENFIFQINERSKEFQVTVGLDIETYPEHPMLSPMKMISIAIDTETVLNIPFITQSGNLAWSTKEEYIRATIALSHLLENPRVTKVIQNSLFDLFVLASLGFKITGPIYDTMLAHMLIYYPSAHSLAYLLSIYADYPAWKTINDTTDAGYRRYNCRDAAVLLMIKPNLDQDMFDNHVYHLFQMDMNIILPTITMMLNGILLDRTCQKDVYNELKSDVDKKIVELRQIVSHPDFNPNSPAQVAYYLFDKMKLKSDVKTKSKKALSTAEDVLNKLALRYPDNAFIESLLEYRNYQKMFSTFSDPPTIDGRVHAIYKLRPVTGRYATETPNIHALPTKASDSQGYIKKMYIASPGSFIFKVDFCQAEIVALAVIANDKRWLDSIHNNKDIHAENMIDVLGEYIPLFRRFFKGLVFGINYGSLGGQIEKKVPKELITRVPVKEIIPKFLFVHPELPEYWKRIEDEITEKHRVTGEWGRIRYFPGKATKAEIREGINFPIQNCVSEIMKLKLILLAQELDLSIVKLIMQKHDEFIFEIPENLLDSSAKIIIQIMNEHVTSPLGKTFPLRVDAGFGKNLLETTPYEIGE